MLEASHAWSHHGIAKPPRKGGWVLADDHGGWTCCVEQGHYGHAARKATWLYAVRTVRPELIWGPCSGRLRLEAGFHTAAERAAASKEKRLVKRLSKKERVGTPPAFADLLIELALSVPQAVAA